jgi:hypothetical protein
MKTKLMEFWSLLYVAVRAFKQAITLKGNYEATLVQIMHNTMFTNFRWNSNSRSSEKATLAFSPTGY